MRLLFTTAAAIVVFFSANSARALPTEYTGWTLDPSLSLDITSYSRVNIDGGVGFQAAARPYYFFHQHVGVFSGLDFANRAMSLNDDKRASWLEVPFGIAFKYATRESMSGKIGLGLYYSKNLTKRFVDRANSIGLDSGLGFILTSSSLFTITETFDLGFQVDLKYSFFSPFETIKGTRSLSLGLGVAGQFQL